jgi:hypothetical protein
VEEDARLGVCVCVNLGIDGGRLLAGWLGMKKRVFDRGFLL